MEKVSAKSQCCPKKPTHRQRTSAGAEVARTVEKMPKPKTVAVLVKEGGGTETFIVSKPLRGGDSVLSGPSTRFARLAREEEEEAPEEAAA